MLLSHSSILQIIKRLPVLLLIIAVACTQKKEPAPATGEAITALRQQIAGRQKRINDTAVAKDTAALLALYRQQTTDSKKAGEWAVFCQSNLAICDLYYDSSTAVSEPYLDAIIALEDTLKQHPALKPFLAQAYGRRYYVYQERELNHNVIHDCEKYLEYSNAALDSSYLVYVLKEAGIAASKIGDQQQSVNYLERLLDYVTRQHDAEEIAAASVNLGNSYNQDNQPGRAMDVVWKALPLNGISPERKAYLNAVLAESYNQLNKKQEALRYVETALPLLQRLPPNTNVTERLSDLCRVQGDVLADMQQPGAALTAYRRSLYYRSQNNSSLYGREAGKTFITIGEIMQSAGQPDSALYYYDRALKAVFPNDTAVGLQRLPRREQLYHENTIMEALDAASTVYLQQYAQTMDAALLQRSLDCSNSAFAVEELLRQLYIYDNSKYSQAQESKSRSRRGIEACRLLWAATGKDKWLDEAFMYAERSRANVLADKIKQNLLTGLSNDSAFAGTRQLWLKIQNISDRIKDIKSDTSHSAELAVLLKEKEQLEALFSRNKSRENALLQEVTKEKPPITMAEIRGRLLEQNDAIIEYFAADSLLYRFVLQKENAQLEMTAVPVHAVDTLVRELLPYLTDRNKYNNQPGEYAHMATQLYRLVFPALNQNNKETKKVLLIADGLLQFLPFEALMKEPAGQNFLVFGFRFTSAFSCGSLLQQMNTAAGSFVEDGIAFAPFNEKVRNSLPVLPQSGPEAASIHRAGNLVQVYKNEQATVKRFMEQSGNGKILHLASHAFAGEADSLPPRIAFADGDLSLEKIYSLQLNNRLVVLSACETGIGRLVTAEGALSLARGFYYAGAKNVINSLWEVNDASAAQIFEQFYRQLKKTGSIDGALALARQEYIRSSPVEKRSPYYWASFVCIGDGVYEPPKDHTRLIVISIAGILGLAILMFVSTRNSRRWR